MQPKFHLLLVLNTKTNGTKTKAAEKVDAEQSTTIESLFEAGRAS